MRTTGYGPCPCDWRYRNRWPPGCLSIDRCGRGGKALVRKPDAGFPPQVETVRGDLTVPETLDECLEGVEKVFLVSTAPRVAVLPALDRIARHARHIVFLSVRSRHLIRFSSNPTRHERWRRRSSGRSRGQGLRGRFSGRGCSPRMPWAGGDRGFGAARRCDGRTYRLLPRRFMKAISRRLRSRLCVKNRSRKANMF